jgi:hypothetical protein
MACFQCLLLGHKTRVKGIIAKRKNELYWGGGVAKKRSNFMSRLTKERGGHERRKMRGEK